MAGPLNEQQHRYLSRIGRNADRLTGMLNELMDLSKIEAGTIELRPSALSLQAVLADLLEAFRPLAQRKLIALEAASAEGLPQVHADREKLYEVLANLLENAIKFTPSEGRIEIGTKVLGTG